MLNRYYLAKIVGFSSLPSVAVPFDDITTLVAFTIIVTRTCTRQNTCSIVLHVTSRTNTSCLTDHGAAAHMHGLTGLRALRAAFRPDLAAGALVLCADYTKSKIQNLVEYNLSIIIL